MAAPILGSPAPCFNEKTHFCGRMRLKTQSSMENPAAGRYRSAIEKGLPDFSGLPEVKEYGPKLGGPRG